MVHMHCGLHCMITVKKEAGVLEKYGPSARIRYPESAKKPPKTTNQVTILAFYFSDPFPLFMVWDHFSCKYIIGLP